MVHVFVSIKKHMHFFFISWCNLLNQSTSSRSLSNVTPPPAAMMMMGGGGGQSFIPVLDRVWERVCKMGGGFGK